MFLIIEIQKNAKTLRARVFHNHFETLLTKNIANISQFCETYLTKFVSNISQIYKQYLTK
jgi:hypothetical protein